MSMTVRYIYKIQNKLNNKIYVGQSKNPASRFINHIKIAKMGPTHANFSAVHGAIRKYGQENFLLEIIEVCDENTSNDREIYWIKFYKSRNNECGYNLTDGGDGVLNLSEESKNKRKEKMLGRKHSEDHKKKISEANKGKIISSNTKRKISIANSGENNGMFGKTISNETRKKLSEFQSSRKRSPLSEEHLQKIKLARSQQNSSFRISKEIKQEIVSLYASGQYTKKQLAEKFNLKYNSVVKIIRSHLK